MEDFATDCLDEGRQGLDKALGGIAAGDVEQAMRELHEILDQRRRQMAHEDWRRFVAECRLHPIHELLLGEPITRRAFEKPRGYAGDAELIDLLYSWSDCSGADDITTRLHRYHFDMSGTSSVRDRCDLVARMIDRTCARTARARVLSLACGHLREAQRSQAVLRGDIGGFVALDQDPITLAVVEREQAASGVTTVCDTVLSILSGERVFRNFDFVYAAGLFDYLPAAIATRLTSRMFEMLRPGGSLLLANFVPESHSRGYAEAFMDWWLIHRDQAELRALSAEIREAEIARLQTFQDELGNIAHLELDRK